MSWIIFNCENLNKSDLIDEAFHKLPADISMLNGLICDRFNRKGTLCSRCKNGTFPMAYSFDQQCVACTDIEANWVKYALVAFIPLTAFCFIICLFQINIMSSCDVHHGFAIYSQAICIPVLSCVLFIGLRSESKYAFFLSKCYSLYMEFGIWISFAHLTLVYAWELAHYKPCH